MSAKPAFPVQVQRDSDIFGSTSSSSRSSLQRLAPFRHLPYPACCILCHSRRSSTRTRQSTCFFMGSSEGGRSPASVSMAEIVRRWRLPEFAGLVLVVLVVLLIEAACSENEQFVPAVRGGETGRVTLLFRMSPTTILYIHIDTVVLCL